MNRFFGKGDAVIEDEYKGIIVHPNMEEFNLLRKHMLDSQSKEVSFIISGPDHINDPTSNVQQLFQDFPIQPQIFNVFTEANHLVKPKKIPYTKNKKWYQQFDQKRF